VLEVGCGIGRNLKSLKTIGVDAVGVDHNVHSVKEANLRGFNALTIDEFNSVYAQQMEVFDSLLVAHVLEHMTKKAAVSLITDYLPLLKKQGRIIIITPQEKGFSSDPTHIEFMDFEKIETILAPLKLEISQKYSFPFPRSFGKLFTHNEFVVVAVKN